MVPVHSGNEFNRVRSCSKPVAHLGCGVAPKADRAVVGAGGKDILAVSPRGRGSFHAGACLDPETREQEELRECAGVCEVVKECRGRQARRACRDFFFYVFRRTTKTLLVGGNLGDSRCGWRAVVRLYLKERRHPTPCGVQIANPPVSSVPLAD